MFGTATRQAAAGGLLGSFVIIQIRWPFVQRSVESTSFLIRRVSVLSPFKSAGLRSQRSVQIHRPFMQRWVQTRWSLRGRSSCRTPVMSAHRWASIDPSIDHSHGRINDGLMVPCHSYLLVGGQATINWVIACLIDRFIT